MGLILQPRLNDKDRAAIEAHIDEVRSRRMTAAIIYQEGENAKLKHQEVLADRRVKQTSSQLANAINALDKADARVAKILDKLTIQLQAHGLLADLIASE